MIDKNMFVMMQCQLIYFFLENKYYKDNFNGIELVNFNILKIIIDISKNNYDSHLPQNIYQYSYFRLKNMFKKND